MIGIYKIESPSGKIYIGQTWNSCKRFSSYRNLYCKAQNKLFNSLKKYGPENHEISIIHELPSDTSQHVMDEYEKFYIGLYKEYGIELLNLREGGSKGKHSQETIRKMSAASIKRNSCKSLVDYMTGNHSKLNRRAKGYYDNRRHPMEYNIEQRDNNDNLIKVWDSIREVKVILGYNSQNLSKAVRKGTKYKNSYWKKLQ